MTNNYIILTITILLIILFSTKTQPEADFVEVIPGYPDSSVFSNRLFSGYLKTSSQLRKLHYIFIQGQGKNNSLPITLWMNGGPGCSSKFGFLQQLSPYLLEFNKNYTEKDNLNKNQFTWLKYTNLLFIDTPAGVGYSINNDTKYVYNDKSTTKDNLDALIYFFKQKFPQYASSSNQFYIAGQSYAGKYIPQLAFSISQYNLNNPNSSINLQGIFMGNPTINFKDGSLQDSQIQFMNNHHFIDPQIYPNWQTSCHKDPKSAGCQFFYLRYEELMRNIDFKNIYGGCIGGKELSSQALFAKKMAKQYSRIWDNEIRDQYERQEQFVDNILYQQKPWRWASFSQCFYSQGIQSYFKNKNNSQKFHSLLPNPATFILCNPLVYQKYIIQQSGSLLTLKSLIGLNNIKIYIYSGDWDDVVPFSDTVKNLYRIGLKQDTQQQPLFKNDNITHIGFKRTYNNKRLKYFIVKAAGHQAVIYKPDTIGMIFQMFLKEKK